MIQTIERTLISKDIFTIFFVFTFCLLVLTRFVFRKEFEYFLAFLVSNKYQNLIAAKQDSIINGFTIVLFIIQLISFAIFSYVAATFFRPELINTPLLFVKIISFFVFFIIIKYIIEKIIAVILDIENHVDTYNFHKINTRNLFGIILIPINLLLVYYFDGSKFVFFSVISLFFLYNLIVLFLLLKNHQKLIINKLFYFILYLCALEIAPYLVIYKFLIK